MTEDDLMRLQDNIARGAKKKTILKKSDEELNDEEKNVDLFGDEENSVDLFGNEIEENIEDVYRKVFNAIVKNKDYIFIRGNVVGKKNNYQAYQRWSGLSNCCNAKYDKVTKICSKCGNKTGSGKRLDHIGLNKRASEYKKNAIGSFRSNAPKFLKQKIDQNFVLVSIFFIRKDNRRFDFDNIQTMVNDLLTESGMIPDDNAKQLIVIPIGYIIDKKNPGVLVKVINHNNYFDFILNELK